MNILGLDVGDRRIGLAVSDENLAISYAFGTLNRKNIEYDLDYIKKIVLKKNIKAIVIGIPYHTDSAEKETYQSKKVKDFGDLLKKQVNIPIYYQDERFTTKESERVLYEAGLNKKKLRKFKDKISAQLILQIFLDKKNEL